MWGNAENLLRLLRLDEGKEKLVDAGIEQICSPPCIGDNF
jgi:hypothetical protein